RAIAAQSCPRCSWTIARKSGDHAGDDIDERLNILAVNEIVTIRVGTEDAAIRKSDLISEAVYESQYESWDVGIIHQAVTVRVPRQRAWHPRTNNRVRLSDGDIQSCFAGRSQGQQSIALDGEVTPNDAAPARSVDTGGLRLQIV